MAHFRPRQPSVKNPFRHATTMHTEINEPKEGDYLSYKQEGEDWPIVICDEEMAQEFSTLFARPQSARQADGTWGKDYKTGGSSFSERCYPALYLGILEFMWAPLKEFEPIDIDVGRAIQNSTSKPLLAKAWTEYTGQFQGGNWKHLDHWKERIIAQRLDKAAPGQSKKEKSHGKFPRDNKHKETSRSKYPPCYHHEASDDEESDDLFLPKTNTSEPKIKREFDFFISSEEMDALYDDPDPPYPTYSQSKKCKIDLPKQSSTKSSTPSRTATSRPATRMPSSVRHGTPLQSTNKRIDANDPNMVIIYVDNPHKRFPVKRTGLDASPLLSKLVTYHPENGWYIMSPMLSSLAANDFKPIGEYIDRGEYRPNILDDGTVHVRLEGDLNPEMLRVEVVRCGIIYQIAEILEMPGLQDLAFRKLKALQPYHQPLEILTVIELLYDIGSPELRQYLTQHVADGFWNLVRAEHGKMEEVMRANEELARGVFWKMCGKDGEIKTVKEEGQGHIDDPDEKGEEVEEAKIEARADGLGEGKVTEEETSIEIEEQTGKEMKDEAIIHAGEMVVEDAPRRPDEERKGEDDWVHMWQKDSALLDDF